jgi:L,D-peptidoglycan transpeptidase YkuD (ErfK/YbiS/YcfS/YnhG family)
MRFGSRRRVVLTAATGVAVAGLVAGVAWYGGTLPGSGPGEVLDAAGSRTLTQQPSTAPAPAPELTRGTAGPGSIPGDASTITSASDPVPARPTPAATPRPAPPAPATHAPAPAVSPRATAPLRSIPANPPKASDATPKPFAFPVPVALGDARQVVTVKARGTYATVVAYQRVGTTWKAVISTTAARIGSGGLVSPTSRKQGTGTTPTGTYTMTEAFGIHTDPGTKMPYHRVTSDDYWVQDNASAYYNTLRSASQGGFRPWLPSSSPDSSEHLIDYSPEYTYAVVIDFNRPPDAVRHRGSGIFLHINGSGATAGCVSVPAATMTALMLWLDPAQHPRIAIG